MARLKLVCMPFAGGGAAGFRAFAQALAPVIEPYLLQSPGREDRLGEPPCADWSAFISGAAAAIASLPPGPIALYGHSLGALAAFDLAGQAKRPPAGLIVSAMAPPEAEDLRLNRLLDLTLPDDLFIDRLGALLGELPETLRDPEVRDVALPILQSDLTLMAGFRTYQRRKMTCPILALSGEADPLAPTATMAGWATQTDAAFSAHALPGGHFFVTDKPVETANRVSQWLGPLLRT